MKVTSTLKNHLRRLDSDTFDILQQVTRMSKDLYNSTLYIQRQHFFENKKIHSLKDLLQLVKKTPQYLCPLTWLSRSCGGELNADINVALNIKKQVVPDSVISGREWNSGDIISSSRIRLVEFM